jgi:hypothetical protein
MARAIADAEAAGYARGLAAGAERWIPCSERMPEPETIVLTCKQGDDEPMMLEVTPDGLTWLSDRGEHLATVGEDDDLVPDFWMPLPDPPAIPVETERKGEV